MKPKPSELKILDFAVTEMEFKLILPSPPYKVNFIEHFKNYDLDLDFSLSNEKVLRVAMTIEINNVEKPLPGYKIKARVTTIFQFEETIKITAEEKKTIESFSTVYMALNNLRGIVSNFTATAPFGRYTIPSIDLNDLIEKKRKKDQEKEGETSTKEKIVEKPPVKRKSMVAGRNIKTNEMNKTD